MVLTLGVANGGILFMQNKNNVLQNRIAKESIFTALMILMDKKKFNEISITEIAKKAGVSRMAFYRNYNLKEDIIISYLDEFFDDYSKKILSNGKVNNYESIRLFFAYFRKHEKFINNLINSKLTNLLFDRSSQWLHSLFQSMVCDESHSKEAEKYIIEFVTGGFFKSLIEWAKSGMKESDEYMAKILCDYCM